MIIEDVFDTISTLTTFVLVVNVTKILINKMCSKFMIFFKLITTVGKLLQYLKEYSQQWLHLYTYWFCCNDWVISVNAIFQSFWSLKLLFIGNWISKYDKNAAHVHHSWLMCNLHGVTILLTVCNKSQRPQIFLCIA